MSIGAPTLTTDRVCTAVTNCTAVSINSVQIAPPTLTSDRVCGLLDTISTSSSAEKLSVGAMSGIIIGALLVLVVGCVLYMYGKKQGVKLETQRREAEELHAIELRGAHDRTESLARRVQRMLAAWQIPWEHVTLNTKLAEGTYGEVWAGLYSNMQVAIKLLKKPTTAPTDENSEYASAVARMNAETAEELRKECETLQMIKHPNLLIFFGAGTSADGRLFMVTELLAGGSLRAVLLDATLAIEWKRRLRIAVHVAAGMQHLHSLSIVHRDLKSDNVLVDRELNAKVGVPPSHHRPTPIHAHGPLNHRMH